VTGTYVAPYSASHDYALSDLDRRTPEEQRWSWSFEIHAYRFREFLRSPLIGNIMNVFQHTSFEIAELRDLLSGLCAGRSTSVYQNDDDIFVQGQAPTRSFYRQKERTKVVAFRCGRKFIIGIVQAGQFIGEAVLGGSAIRLTTVRVMENSELISISLSTMQRSLRSCPGLADLFTTYLLRKTRRIEADFVDQILNLAQKRLARTLLILSNLQNNTGLTSTPIHFDQTTIARMVGCNRSRFNLFMNRFRKLGFISYSNRSFTALQENRLRSFVAGVRGVLSYA
jgi:CRP/FNR family cyclic AMP-dependent transcriptional regulator